MSHLSISLLGLFQVSLAGQPVSGFETVKTRALLAYLADGPGRAHSRSTLANLLWPERTETAALNNLRHNLAVLRGAIHDPAADPPCLLIDRETITFNPESGCTIDTQDFRRLVATADNYSQAVRPRLDCLEQAVSLFRGDFLEAFALDDSADFETWLLLRRELYRSQALEALYQLAEAGLARGDYDRARGYARRQIAIEPWCEEAHRQLMAALALEGQRSAALAQYAACRKLLAQELDVEPSPATAQLFECIRAGDLSAAPLVLTARPGVSIEHQPLPTQASRQHNLPRSITSFIGREAELGQVKRLLAGQPLVMLTGSGGVGKSRLAVEAAAGMLSDFKDGVWLVELAPLDNPAQLTGAVARALGLGAGPVQPAVAGLVAYLANRQTLLILDNCEHLIAACADLAPALLQSCPQLKILATSRQILGLPGEVVYRVPSLAFPDGQKLLSPAAILDYAAVRLFVARGQAAFPAFKVTERNLQPVARICQRLDGIPLALELAATRLDLLGAEQLAARLNGTFHLLTGGSRTALPRRQTLRATIDWSYQLLSPQERRLLQRLAIFAGGWTLEAAEAVCAGEDLASGDVLDSLTGLVNKSMAVAERHSGKETRFRLLETVRQYARDRLRQAGEEGQLRAQHCAYFLRLAEIARPRLRNAEHLAWMQKLDAERDNLFRAIRWAIDEAQDIAAGLQILVRLDRWWPQRGYFQQGLAWLRQGIASWKDPPATQKPLHVQALCLLANAETDPATAHALTKQALALAGELGPEDRFVLAYAYYVAGALARVWDWDGQAAAAYLNRSLQIYQDLGPGYSWEQAFLLDEKSCAALLMENEAEARALASESWRMFQATGDRWFAYPLKRLGVAAMRQGNYPQARAYFEQALAQGAGVEDVGGLSDLELLGILERRQGHYRAAVAYLRAAVQRSSQYYFNYALIELLQELAFTEIECSRDWPMPENERSLLQAARLLGAAEACGTIDWLKSLIFPKKIYAPMVAELRARLDPARLEQAWGEGLAMPVEWAVAYALEYPLN